MKMCENNYSNLQVHQVTVTERVGEVCKTSPDCVTQPHSYELSNEATHSFEGYSNYETADYQKIKQNLDWYFIKVFLKIFSNIWKKTLGLAWVYFNVAAKQWQVETDRQKQNKTKQNQVKTAQCCV